MIGQEALNIAEGFNKVLPVSGLVFTKTMRCPGAAISIRITGIPIKFLGTECGRAGGLWPGTRGNRILGMGDILGLIERAEAAYGDDKTSKR